MLVLGRTKSESIDIIIPPSSEQRRVRVMLCAIHHGKTARLGVEADKDIKILRSELPERES